MSAVIRFVLAMCAAVVLPATATAQETLFDDGNRHYRESNYEEALKSYLQIVDAGFEGAPLYYNIGNCYFKLGDLGRSILFYERALAQNPRDDDARANLELARSLTADEIEPLPGFWVLNALDWWVHALPRAWLTSLVGFGYLVAMGSLIALILGRRLALVTWSRRTAVVGGLILLVFGVNLAVLELDVAQPTEAIVLADEVSVQSAPTDDQALQVFTVHEGAKARVEQQSGEWAEIVLADGKVGWVRLEVLEII